MNILPENLCVTNLRVIYQTLSACPTDRFQAQSLRRWCAGSVYQVVCRIQEIIPILGHLQGEVLQMGIAICKRIIENNQCEELVQLRHPCRNIASDCFGYVLITTRVFEIPSVRVRGFPYQRCEIFLRYFITVTANVKPSGYIGRCVKVSTFGDLAMQKCPPLTVYSKMFTLRLKVTRISLAV